jgi:3-dehydroquinate synthase
MMKQLTVAIPAKVATSYPIAIGKNLLPTIIQYLKKLLVKAEVVIITDHRVKKLYGQALATALTQQGYNVRLFSFAAGEKSKQQHTKAYLEERMFRAGCDRQTVCLALGGGVVGDLTGFLAATYMRGISYIQIPTTLLAMVDSSVGGKTGIDNSFGKNLVGAFWQPKAVIMDLVCLKSLPQQQLINGLIEAIKIFLTHDAKSFAYVVKNLAELLACHEKNLSYVIHRAVAIKAAVVEQDEQEAGLRAVLNFGHTIAHALEQISNYKILHGYAVAYGILVEAKIAEILGVLSAENYLVIKAIFAKLGILTKDLSKIAVSQVIQLTKLDKKVQAGKVQYVLLKNVGQVYEQKHSFVHPVSDEIVKQAFLEIGCYGR